MAESAVASLSNENIHDAITLFGESIALLSVLLTDNERLDLWSNIANGYCRHCGIRLKHNGVCFCQNDD